MKQAFKAYSILYAEDNQALQESTVEYLQRYFGTVYVADDGEEALALYEKHNIDVLLLDIDMPLFNGLDVTKCIRQDNEAVPIMILTAYTDTELLLKATELNLCKYLVKPLNPMVFKEVLKKVHMKLLQNNPFIVSLSNGYSWNSQTKVLRQDREMVMLSQKEQILFTLLMKNKGKCVSFEEIMAVVWEDEFEKEISRQSIKLQVTLLRKKLPKECIVNVYGRGYVLNM